MPQFWPQDFAPQLVWLAISFALLYWLMSNVALPKIASVLEQRQERIADDLDRAKQLKEEAEQVLADYEAALSEARTKAQIILAEAATEMAERADARHAEVGARLQDEADAAAARIAAATDEAMADMRDVSVELAKAAADRLVEADISKTDVTAAVDRAIERRPG